MLLIPVCSDHSTWTISMFRSAAWSFLSSRLKWFMSKWKLREPAPSSLRKGLCTLFDLLHFRNYTQWRLFTMRPAHEQIIIVPDILSFFVNASKMNFSLQVQVLPRSRTLKQEQKSKSILFSLDRHFLSLQVITSTCFLFADTEQHTFMGNGGEFFLQESCVIVLCFVIVCVVKVQVDSNFLLLLTGVPFN